MIKRDGNVFHNTSTEKQITVGKTTTNLLIVTGDYFGMFDINDEFHMRRFKDLVVRFCESHENIVNNIERDMKNVRT